MKGVCALVVLFLLCLEAKAQECPYIHVEGRVVDTLSRQSFYNLLVINRTKATGVIGSPDGSFSLNANKGDTINLSISGYRPVSFIVNGYNCKQHKTIILSLVSYQSQAVIVKPLKTLDEIKEDRENLVLKETRKLKGFKAFSSPITALYERFSKTAKSKSKAAKLQHQDDVNDVVKELLRVYVSYDIVALDESEFVDFVYFMNISEGFLKTASDYQLIMFIKSKLKQYRRLNDYYYQKE